MRRTSIALAVVATLAIPAIATAQTGTGNKGDPSGSSNNAGNPPGANTTQGPVNNQTKGGSSTTGIGGGTSGSSQQPNATNNPQTGTQAPDAQKGGSGSQGAR